MHEIRKHCRWCGSLYIALKLPYQDGFCCLKHKQAHYRAYKKYVTSRTSNVDINQAKPVTRKEPRTGVSTGTGKRKKRK